MAAMTEVATSGSEVPAATMVRPITTLLTPSALAMLTAASTIKRLPKTRSASPTKIEATEASPLAPAASLASAFCSADSGVASRRAIRMRKTV